MIVLGCKSEDNTYNKIDLISQFTTLQMLAQEQTDQEMLIDQDLTHLMEAVLQDSQCLELAQPLLLLHFQEERKLLNSSYKN